MYIDCTPPVKPWAVRASLCKDFDVYAIFVHPPEVALKFQQNRHAKVKNSYKNIKAKH